MRRTLLEIVQHILSSMDSFDVNSIADTTESEQVAEVVRQTYYDIVSSKNWWFLRRTLQLNSGTASRPTHLSVPDNIKELVEVRYNTRLSTDTRDKYSTLKYLYPDEFLTLVNARDSSATEVTSVTDPGGVALLSRNDAAPTYWTSFDDRYIVCDSYDSDVDTFLQNSKTQCIAFVEPTWTHSDNEYPDLPSEMFSQLVNEAKSRAWYELKQQPNEKAEQESTRQRRRNSRKGWK